MSKQRHEIDNTPWMLGELLSRWVVDLYDRATGVLTHTGLLIMGGPFVQDTRVAPWLIKQEIDEYLDDRWCNPVFDLRRKHIGFVLEDDGPVDEDGSIVIHPPWTKRIMFVYRRQIIGTNEVSWISSVRFDGPDNDLIPLSDYELCFTRDTSGEPLRERSFRYVESDELGIKTIQYLHGGEIYDE